MVGGNVYDSGFNNSYVPDKELFIRWLEISAFMPSIQDGFRRAVFSLQKCLIQALLNT